MTCSFMSEYPYQSGEKSTVTNVGSPTYETKEFALNTSTVLYYLQNKKHHRYSNITIIIIIVCIN